MPYVASELRLLKEGIRRVDYADSLAWTENDAVLARKLA
jgi:hypothetical protein